MTAAPTMTPSATPAGLAPPAPGWRCRSQQDRQVGDLLEPRGQRGGRRRRAVALAGGAHDRDRVDEAAAARPISASRSSGVAARRAALDLAARHVRARPARRAAGRARSARSTPAARQRVAERRAVSDQVGVGAGDQRHDAGPHAGEVGAGSEAGVAPGPAPRRWPPGWWRRRAWGRRTAARPRSASAPACGEGLQVAVQPGDDPAGDVRASGSFDGRPVSSHSSSIRVVMSLSPRPDRVISTVDPRGQLAGVPAARITQATACADSSAGTMPSVRASRTAAVDHLVVGDRDVPGPAQVAQVRVLRADAGVVEPGRDRVRLHDLPVSSCRNSDGSRAARRSPRAPRRRRPRPRPRPAAPGCRRTRRTCRPRWSRRRRRRPRSRARRRAARRRTARGPRRR